MSSTFLNQIGLGEFDMGYLLIGMGAVILLLIIFLILLIVQIRKTSKLKKRLDKFLSGKDGASLEKDIAGLYEDNKFLKANTEKNKKDIRTLYKNMESAYQKMGLVKYDAFNQMGGQLSFSLALLDENNNGFIINSVHSSEGCYSYTKEAAKEFLDMGFFIGVGGVVTFKNARKLVETVEEVPVTRIVLETDSPYMAPEPHRGTRNDSRNIRYVAEKIAQIKGITAQEVIDITNENAKKLFF